MRLAVLLLAELSLVVGAEVPGMGLSSGVPFIRKCCPEGMKRSRKGCIPGARSFKVPEGYDLVFGKPNCPMYPLTDDDMLEAEVLANGSILLSGDIVEYCQDWSAHHEDVRVTFVCFPPLADEISEDESRLKVYSVGMILSLPFLFATFLVYACFKRLKNLHGRCVMTHCFCMIVSYICLILVQNQYYMNDCICVFIGYAIQFFFMATFFWLNVMCFDIYWAFSGLRNLTGSVKERERKKLILYSCYAWGVPLFILLLTVGMDYSPYVPNDSIFKPAVGIDKCFFQKDIATGIYFYMPMGFVLLMNIVLFSITAFRICSLRRETAVLKRGDSRKHDSTNDKESVTDLQTKFLENKKTPIASSGLMIDATKEPYIVKNIRFSLYLKLFLVMGINWVMELVSYLAGGPSYIWYIPDFTNTLQGVFIFIIFVWKERVRRLVWAKITSCCGCKVVSNPSRGQWTTSTRNTNSITNSSGITSNSIKMAPMPLTETNGVDNGVSNGMSNGMSNGGINNDRNVDANNAPPQGLA